jgi:hypothetical protein
MNNETIIIKPEHAKEIRTIFRKLVASGSLDSDKAIAKILRDFPHFFHQPTEDDIAKISRDELNGEIRRRAQQTNRLADGFFRG